MDAAVTVTPAQLPTILLNVATVRPVFVWGAPGIGKSSLVEAFSTEVGMDCVSLVGTQLAAEDLMGVPQIFTGDDGVARSRFAPPELIARTKPFVLFADELNASSHDVMKSMYSLILDQRIGGYTLPKGSVVIAAGNRAVDQALARTLPSALVNRMLHVHLRATAADWLTWAVSAGIHPWILDYLTERPTHLFSPAPKVEAPFSTPRSWHILSDTLHAYDAGAADSALDDHTLETLTGGTLTAEHASAFRAYVKRVRNQYGLEAILKGELGWPARMEDRDLLFFLAETLRDRMIKELPASKDGGSANAKAFAHRAKALLVELAEISMECAQMVVANDAGGQPVLPAWFLTEVVRDLPRLVAARA